MEKQSKITVKHFLNKRLKPQLPIIDGKTRYPLYVQATFQKKIAQFKSLYFTQFGFETRYMNENEFKNETYYLEIEQKRVEKIITILNQNNVDFDFSNFSEIYKKYSVFMVDLIENRLYKLFFKEAEKQKITLPSLFYDTDFTKIQEAIELLNTEITLNFSEFYKNCVIAYEIFNHISLNPDLYIGDMMYIEWQYSNGKQIFVEYGENYVHSFYPNEIEAYNEIVKNVDLLIAENNNL